MTESRNERIVECEKSKVDHNVTLASGHHAGVFLKANKSIVTMKRCLQQCCQMKGCDVAFFSNGACYSVKCSSIDSCAPRMNLDKRMMISISFVAKPKVTFNRVTSEKGVEREVTDNLIAEVTPESPFVDDDNFDENPVTVRSHDQWKETKEAVLAVVCGFVAVAVGVAGVIIMTRQLVDDDEPYPTNLDPQYGKLSSSMNKENILPTIRESEDENELDQLTIGNDNQKETTENHTFNLPTILEDK